MRITKRQLRRIIREAAGDDFFSDREANPHDGSMYGEPEGGQRQYEEYEAWVKETGQVTPAASSVMATYFVEQGLTDDEEQIDTIAVGYRVDPQDVMRDIDRQQKEYGVGGVLSDEEDYERGFKEGVSPESMPDSWRQILGNCLKG